MSIATSLVFAGAIVGAKAAVILAAAAFLDRVAPRRFMSAAARHLMFTLAIAATLLLPALHWSLLQSKLAIPVLPAAIDAAHASRTAADAEIESAASSVGRESASELPSWPAVAIVVYATGALLLLVRLVAQQRLIRSVERGAREGIDAEWAAESREIASRFGVTRPVALLTGDDRAMPLTWGMLRPRVLLPAAARAWSPSQRRAVLLHELSHVARRDCLTQSVAAVVCALYWPLPLAWWAARRLRIERELACDDRALEAGLAADDYAVHLLTIAKSCAPAPRLTMAVSMAGMSPLETRLRAVVDDRRSRRAPAIATRLAGAAAMLALLLPLAAITSRLAIAATVMNAPTSGIALTSSTAANSTNIAVQPPSSARARDRRSNQKKKVATGLDGAKGATARPPESASVTSGRGIPALSRTDAAVIAQLATGAIGHARMPIPPDLSSLKMPDMASLAALDSLNRKVALLERMIATETPVSTTVNGDKTVRTYRNGIVVVDSADNRTFHMKQ